MKKLNYPVTNANGSMRPRYDPNEPRTVIVELFQRLEILEGAHCQLKAEHDAMRAQLVFTQDQLELQVTLILIHEPRPSA